jgi:DNA-binding MarR family transcriptional regulator
MDPAEELRFLVLGAQREGGRALAELLKPIGLTAAQAEVLAVLRDAGGGLTLRELGDRLVCEAGSPSRLVGSVVDAGLVDRTTRADDRRAVQLTLTARGEEAARRVAEAEGALHGWLDDALSERERTAVIRALRKLVDGRPAGDALARRRASAR